MRGGFASVAALPLQESLLKPPFLFKVARPISGTKGAERNLSFRVM